MTDKVIIDGIDVSECSWCDCEPNTEPYCRINDGEDLNCKENPNCYFKLLARAKEENEKLSEQLDGNNVIIDRFLIASGKNKDLTEPEDFERVFEDIEQTYSEHEEWREEIEKLRNLQDDLVKENENLKSKIKELEEWKQATRATGICEICTHKNVQIADEYRHAICEIERLLKDALDTEKTNTDESFENFYKCLDIIGKLKE